MLKTDGSGNLGWRTDVEGTITSVGNMSDNRVITASGATTLNGEALRQDAATQMDKLDQELTTYADGGDPLHFIIG